MKLLKSPVFYFGIFLLVTVVAALLAPYVIDWGRYRGDLQAWGEKLTGRQIAIRGDIKVKLFPFPQLTADNVVIANPDGFKEPVFASIDRVRVQITLGGLINGDLQVEAIDLERPTATLIRTGEDRFNWTFEPAGSVRNSPLLEHVLLDQIRVVDGHLFFVDEVRSFRTSLEKVEATLSAPSLAGPWRSAGSFSHNGNSTNFSVTTASWDQAKPLSLAVRLSPTDGAGYSIVVEAQTEAGGRFSGRVMAQPIVDDEGKSDSEGRMRSVTFSSDFEAGFRRVELKKIEIRPADSKDQGTLITGSASAEIGQVVSARMNISAPRVDLDTLAGAGSRQLLRNGGGLALLNGLLGALPAEVELNAGVEVLALKAGGENLDSARLKFTANRQEVRVSNFSANLPGRSRMLFDGVFYPGERAAELGGKLSVETFDARQLVLWLAPEGKEYISRVWTGNRGQLKFESVVRLTASKLDFSDVAYELNGDPGTGHFALLVNGERPILDAGLNAKRLDLDSFVSTAATVGSASNWSWFLQNFAEEQSRRDLNLSVTADELILNGVTAQGLVTRIETTVRGFDLKQFEVAALGGAKITASGLILNSDAGADGDINASLIAEDPRELLQLIGVAPRSADARWTDALGKTDLNISLAARAGGVLTLTTKGSSGEFTVTGQGALDAEQLDKMSFNGNLQVASAKSASFAKMLGMKDVVDDNLAASLNLGLDGQITGDVRTKADGKIYNVAVKFDGVTNPAERRADGRLEISSADLMPVLRAAKVPLVGEAQSRPVSVAGTLKLGAGSVELSSLTGTWGEGPFSGNLSLAGGKMTGEISAGWLSFAQALAPAFLPWTGSASLEDLFSAELPGGLTAELWINPKQLEIYPGFTVPDGQVAITAEPGKRQVTAYGKGKDGEKVSADITLQSTSLQHKLTGKFAMPFDLGQALKQDNDGQPFSGIAEVDVSVSGEGLSPAAAIATANGSGAFNLKGVTIKGVSPERFSQTIGSAKDPAGLQASLDAMNNGAGISVQPTFGSVAIENGVAKVTPFSLNTADAAVTLTTKADLGSGLMDIAVQLGLKALPNLPQMTVVYHGAPEALQRRDEAGELAAYLGFKVLNSSVDELEKLQAEQARLAKLEELQREDDARKLALYTAQRSELRLRQRQLRIWATDQERYEAAEAARLNKLSAATKALNAIELGRRNRELSTYRKVQATP